MWHVFAILRAERRFHSGSVGGQRLRLRIWRGDPAGDDNGGGGNGQQRLVRAQQDVLATVPDWSLAASRCKTNSKLSYYYVC